jgi:hypothetical protein
LGRLDGDCPKLGRRVPKADIPGWPGTLILSEEIKDALERMGAAGTKFEEV